MTVSPGGPGAGSGGVMGADGVGGSGRTLSEIAEKISELISLSFVRTKKVILFTWKFKHFENVNLPSGSNGAALP